MNYDVLKEWEIEAHEIVKDWSSFPTDPERDNKRILALIQAYRVLDEALKLAIEIDTTGFKACPKCDENIYTPCGTDISLFAIGARAQAEKILKGESDENS